MKLALTTIFLAVTLVLFTSPTFAQQDTVLNVHTDQPLAIPGHVLPAGNYVFRMMDETAYPDVVRVMSADGSTYGLFQLVPARRAEPGDSSVTISSPDGIGLRRISSWYFPGEKDGYEFVYTHRDVAKLDRVAKRMGVEPAGGL